MPIVNILTFVVIFIFIGLAGLSIFLAFHNMQARITIDRFIKQVAEQKPVVFQSIKLRYTTTNGLKTYVSPKNLCDLYLLDNCIAIAPKQRILFNILSAPVLISPDVEITKTVFTYLDTYKPASLIFDQTIKGELDIRLVDPVYKHYTTDITLKGLTKEQVDEFEKIKHWC